MRDFRSRWPQYFNNFVLISSIYLIGGIVLFALIELAEFFGRDIDIFDHNDDLSFYVIGSIAAVSMLATIACVVYIAFGGKVNDFRWGWGLILFVAMFFNFTGFILLLFYSVCLRESKGEAART